MLSGIYASQEVLLKAYYTATGRIVFLQEHPTCHISNKSPCRANTPRNYKYAKKSYKVQATNNVSQVVLFQNLAIPLTRTTHHSYITPS